MAEQAGPVAITGAAGFIGSYVVEDFLRAGHHVRALVHYNALGFEGHLAEVRAALPEESAALLEVRAGDVGDFRCMRELVDGCNTVCHLAALIGIPYSYSAPQSYVNTNILGTLNILEACREHGALHLIHTSTSEVYGTARTTPMAENHPLQAQSPYSASKISADKLVESYHLSYGLPTTTIRPFNTFGPRQSRRAIVPTIIAQALHQGCETIRLGSLDPVRDFTFVSDTARAFRLAAEAAPDAVSGKAYNLGRGKGISIGNLAELIMEVLEVRKPVESDEERRRPDQSEVRTLISDNLLARKELEWRPEVSLEEGIQRTADYLRPLLANIDPEEYVR